VRLSTILRPTRTNLLAIVKTSLRRVATSAFLKSPLGNSLQDQLARSWASITI